MSNSLDLKPEETIAPGFLDRFRKSWFPPAAVVGAFAAFVAAALRIRPTPKIVSAAPANPATKSAGSPPVPAPAPAYVYQRQYTQTLVLGGSKSAHPFQRSLGGLDVDAKDAICTLGDDEVRIFASDGTFMRSWKVPGNAACLAADSDGKIYLGISGRVEIYRSSGDHIGGFAAGTLTKPADITAIRIFKQDILVADATARLIRRFDSSGKQIGDIGSQSKSRSFMLPNRSLDFSVDASGIVRAGDSGRHRVTAWTILGAPLGFFGKFGQKNPEDFTGCCNPVNIATTPEGKVVTAEKAMARVKVYEPDGKLLAMIGPEHFDPACVHLNLAVDSKGRILTADPVRREIKIFSPVIKSGRLESGIESRAEEFEQV